MATYTVTEDNKKEIMDIPNSILPYDSSIQLRTFPFKQIFEGIDTGLEPEVIGNQVYDSICNLTLRNFTDIVQPDSIKDYAKFIQAAVQKKLATLKTA